MNDEVIMWPEAGAEPDRLPPTSRQESVELVYGDGSPAGYASRPVPGRLDDEGNLQRPDVRRADPVAVSRSSDLSRAGGPGAVCGDWVRMGRITNELAIPSVALALREHYGGAIETWEQGLRAALAEHREGSVMESGR